jgi:hypothetical protein
MSRASIIETSSTTSRWQSRGGRRCACAPAPAEPEQVVDGAPGSPSPPRIFAPRASSARAFDPRPSIRCAQGRRLARAGAGEHDPLAKRLRARRSGEPGNLARPGEISFTWPTLPRKGSGASVRRRGALRLARPRPRAAEVAPHDEPAPAAAEVSPAEERRRKGWRPVGPPSAQEMERARAVGVAMPALWRRR